MAKPPLLKIDTERQEVFVRGKRINLAPREYRVLIVLRDAGKTLSRKEILSEIGVHSDDSLYARTVDQHIARLRKALKIDVIATVTTFGYRYDG